MGDTFRTGDELRDADERPKFRLPLLAGKAPAKVASIDEQVAAAARRCWCSSRRRSPRRSPR